ncbi:hypothetical protein M2283_010208 [Streptomyces pseudovenezuelae]|uniref:Uncharacterized protein n=1 Tax=Streptomyces pseudovenezuelae TaxID=67350 RepID=A0ABT6M2V2_9ACTN|nr:hypothetical protein [Streptomyces pseudovenezuelae]
MANSRRRMRASTGGGHERGEAMPDPLPGIASPH